MKIDFSGLRVFAHRRCIPLLFTLYGTMVLLVSCTMSVSSGNDGSGTGVGNGIVVGNVMYPDSTPVIGAVVRLRTSDYLADTSGQQPVNRTRTQTQTVTDSHGNFSIDSIDIGYAYCVEVVDSKKQVMGTLYKTTSITRDTNRLNTRIVKPVSKIVGSIVLSGLPQNAYVQVYGLERLGRTDANGKFEIQALPIGDCEHLECEYKLRIFSPQANGGIKVLETELEVKSDLAGNVLSVELELDD
jgi:hypothetical protein